MERVTGHYVPGSLSSIAYQAWVPAPLPPEPPLSISPSLLAQLERANQAVGRLDGITTTLPEPDLFLYQYIRKEALVSSQIEGTQSSLTDLMLYELAEAPGVPIDDVEEVSNYIAALQHGLERLRGGFPLSLRLIREIHAILLRGGRGARMTPGEFRLGQNWIGGRSPAEARFVPPPPEQLDACLAALERFLHVDDVPPLVKSALAHVQFETIHPFNDGNGRVGRLLITLLLCVDGVLRFPSLYLSLFFKIRRAEYYQHLQNVRVRGDWEAWLHYFLEGVERTSNQAVETARSALALFERDRARVRGLGRRAANTLAVLDVLMRRPLQSVPHLATVLPLTRPTLRAAIGALEALGIVVELTGQQRNRIYMYRDYYDLLARDAAPL